MSISALRQSETTQTLSILQHWEEMLHFLIFGCLQFTGKSTSCVLLQDRCALCFVSTFLFLMWPLTGNESLSCITELYDELIAYLHMCVCVCVYKCIYIYIYIYIWSLCLLTCLFSSLILSNSWIWKYNCWVWWGGPLQLLSGQSNRWGSSLKCYCFIVKAGLHIQGICCVIFVLV